MLVLCGFAEALETSISLNNGRGWQLYATSANGTFSMKPDDFVGTENLSVSFQSPSLGQFWRLNFAAERNQPLSARTYINAEKSYGRDPKQPGLEVSGTVGSACGTINGSFQIKEITATSLWVTFEQQCDKGRFAPIFGEVRINVDTSLTVAAPLHRLVERGHNLNFDVTASESAGRPVTITAIGLPPGASFSDHHNGTGTFVWTPGFDVDELNVVTFQADNGQGRIDRSDTILSATGETSLTITSQPGDFVGYGQNYFLNGATSSFFVSKLTYLYIYSDGVVFDVTDGSYENRWALGFSAPAGEPLSAGRYSAPTIDVGSYNHSPGLSISKTYGSCTSITGSFEIKAISYASNNTVKSFWATFEQHCNGAAAALFGEIRYNANTMLNVHAPYERISERGHVLSIGVSAQDANSRGVSLSARNLPAGADFVDHGNNTGTLSWKPTFAQTGNFIVTFVADNGQGAISTTDTVIKITGDTGLYFDGELPDITGPGSPGYFSLEDTNFTAAVSDANRVTFSYAAPYYRYFGSISFRTPNGQPLTPGSYDNATGLDGNPYLGVSLGSWCEATGRFDIKQIEYGPGNSINSLWASFEQKCNNFIPKLSGELRFNVSPAVILSGPRQRSVARGRTLTFSVVAAERSGLQTVLTATGLPPGSTFTDNGNNTGTFVWTPDANQTGSIRVTFRADSGAGTFDTLGTSIEVLEDLSITVTGNGIILTSGANCPGDCTEAYAGGSRVWLRAIPAVGYEIGEWSGCDTVEFDRSCFVQMSRARNVSVKFKLILYRLDVLASPNGAITASGISCPGHCSESYASGTSLTLTVAPFWGYQAFWYGCDTVSGNLCTVRMTYDKQVMVSFYYVSSYPVLGYLPLRSGNVWTYTANEQCCVTMSVMDGTAEINGVATKAVQSSDGYTQYLTNDGEGIRLHAEWDPENGVSVVYVPPVRLAKAIMFIGETVNTQGVARTNFGDFSFAAGFTLEGLDHVSLSSRNYPVLRIRGGLSIPSGGILWSTMYLSKNVGIIKEMQSLYPDNYTTELQATNVSGVDDFDGDGKSDVGIYRNGTWSILRSSDGGYEIISLGESQYLPVTKDYDGDGITDAAVYLNGVWLIERSTDGVIGLMGFGGPSQLPVPADYDGDGKVDIAVYLDGVWSIKRSTDGVNEVVAHGGPGWTPVPADYDGDGKADHAVYLNGAWSIKRSSDGGITVVGHGGPAWHPVPGDYDGDGKADVAVYTNGAWSIKRSSDNTIAVSGHGGPAWLPVPADYDGDGKTDVAVYNPLGAWCIINSSTNAITVVGHGGGPADVPLN